MTKTTAIIGLGQTGFSCLRHLYGSGRLVVLDTRVAPPFADQQENFPDVEFRLGKGVWDDADIDRVVLSPGLSMDDPLLLPLRRRGVPFVSDIDLFCAEAQAPIIGITGTNGKSTVTALAAHQLQRLGCNAIAGGNLGLPALDLLDEAIECYVLELSSFQLERSDCQSFAAATILNISEDHVDQHGDMATYVAAKQRIYARAERQIFNRQDNQTQPSAPGGKQMSFGHDAPVGQNYGIRQGKRGAYLAFGDRCISPFDQFALQGSHNRMNLMAACALLHHYLPDPSQLVQAAAGFTGLPHRFALVLEQEGIRYINDSKATNVGATLAALTGMDSGKGQLILIAGGEGKGAEFGPLLPALARGTRGVILFGKAARELDSLLKGTISTRIVDDMTQAVALASNWAQPGDTVLLSPACASLDMYANFAARGDAFVAAVKEVVS